jgi:GMP synthase-like glutamine amidotransferase
MRSLIIHEGADFVNSMLHQVLDDFGYEPILEERSKLGRANVVENLDLLVHLGSDWSVYSPETIKHVRVESQLIAEAMSRGIPVFGICFGAQMIAHVLGGNVRRSPTPEFGWTNVTSPDHPQINGEWMQWHSDLIELPPGVEALGFNEICVQAFRYKRSFGVQFHPEATYDLVLNWISTGGNAELEANGVDPEGILRSARVHESSAEVRLRALFDWFLQDVAST